MHHDGSQQKQSSSLLNVENSESLINGPRMSNSPVHTQTPISFGPPNHDILSSPTINNHEIHPRKSVKNGSIYLTQ